MAHYQMNSDKLDAVTELCCRYIAEKAGVKLAHINDESVRDDVRDFCFADWAEGDEHQAWLDSASEQEIADWVISGKEWYR